MTIAQHLSKTSEHYTPVEIVEAARAFMGGIDLDPASGTREDWFRLFGAFGDCVAL